LEYKDDIRRVYKNEEYRKLLENKENDYSSFLDFIKANGILSV
jgi:hypothetical protein